MQNFCHLHCHTQYSLLDGAANVASLISQAKLLGMEALAITDHGNMFGVPQFVTEAKKQGIKPIIGCEFYVADDMFDRKNKRRYHQLILAKNEVGYKNLIKLCSLGYTKGYYYKPRIDKKCIKQYAKGLVATTCCLAAEVPRAILSKSEEEAEKILLEWVGIFGKENYYIELQRHGIKEQDVCNKVLCKWAKKHGLKIIATNDVHYIKQEDSKAHDLLLCLQTGSDVNDPKRMRFDNDQFFLKSPKQMAELFADVPEAIDNTVALADSIESLTLERKLVLPVFPIPQEFETQHDYLRHLTLQRAEKLGYGSNKTYQDRIDHELAVIKKLRYSGYFLIVQDLVHEAKNLGIMVGPGRGSVVGSLVACSLGITTIDPLQYKLFFERFLNEHRIGSSADIDLDFDDKGRELLIKFLIEKYGHDRVAQIITFGSMGVKTAIRDVARVLKLPLKDADKLAKLVPDQPNITFEEAFKQTPELASFQKDKNSPEGKVLNMAIPLEGCVRHTGVHAAGIIITPGILTHYMPACIDKKSNIHLTQYDGVFAEKVGGLKIDVLGLKNLSILKTAQKWIKKEHNLNLNLNKLPLNDTKTFQLFQRGDTVGIFQFDSEFLRKWFIKLKPNHIEDLIAMNALNRPGPMQFIPNFINRKHGKEKIDYPHPLLADILKQTYGIMVYQEQIMQAAQIIAGYTLAQADILRYAMGKKKVDQMAKQRAVFIAKSQEKQNISEKKAIEIFDMMEKFSRYGFNRSHAVAYALIAYQTAFLKANYPVEFMAAVLTHNQQDIDKIAFFIQECKRLNIPIQSPDINLSHLNFTPNKNAIRFGLAGIKDLGEGAVELMIQERTLHGPFKNLYDFTNRMASKKINKKMLERLAMVGAFDRFQPTLHRKQYTFTPDQQNNNLIERSMHEAKKRYENQQSQQLSLFASEPTSPYTHMPKPPNCTPYTQTQKLNIEKELLGFYVSGHPLDNYQAAIHSFCNAHTQNSLKIKNKEVKLAGIVTNYKKRQNKKGTYYATLTLEDYKGELNLQIFGEKYTIYHHLLEPGNPIYLTAVAKERYGQKDTHYLQIKTIEPLNQLIQKATKNLSINLTTQKLSKDFIESLHQTIQKYPGTCQLQINLLNQPKTTITTLSTRYQIKPEEQLLQDLNSLKINYTLRTTKIITN